MEWLGPSALCHPEICRVPVGVLGVYAIQLFDQKAGAYPVLYIGQSRDLQRRLREHCDGTPGAPIVTVGRSMGPTYFSILRLDHETMLSPAESALVRLLRPPGNKQVPGARPLFVPVPPILTPFSRLRTPQPTWSP